MGRNAIKRLRYGALCLAVVLVCMVVARAVTVSAGADEQLAQVDEFIKAQENSTLPDNYPTSLEPETVSLSYSEWQDQKNGIITGEFAENPQNQSLNVEEMDIWTLGENLYGISANDTSRILKIISYEGYGDSPLSYYVACCCLVRATEGYWGYSNIYSAFGEADTSYDEWMDGIEIEDWAYDYLYICYTFPSYVRYCNGMTVPESWVYEEEGIYAW